MYNTRVTFTKERERNAKLVSVAHNYVLDLAVFEFYRRLHVSHDSISGLTSL